MVIVVDMFPNMMPRETHLNYSFLIDNAENDLGLRNDEFNYIYVRLLYGLRDLCCFVTRAFKALMPGGYIKIKEFEFPL